MNLKIWGGNKRSLSSESQITSLVKKKHKPGEEGEGEGREEEKEVNVLVYPKLSKYEAALNRTARKNKLLNMRAQNPKTKANRVKTNMQKKIFPIPKVDSKTAALNRNARKTKLLTMRAKRVKQPSPPKLTKIIDIPKPDAITAALNRQLRKSKMSRITRITKKVAPIPVQKQEQEHVPIPKPDAITAALNRQLRKSKMQMQMQMPENTRKIKAKRTSTVRKPTPQEKQSYLLPNAKNIDKYTIISATDDPTRKRQANLFYAKMRKTLRKFKNAYNDEYNKASCVRTPGSGISLKAQQLFVREYINNYTPFTGLVLWHGLGSGKTLSAISIGEQIAVDTLHHKNHIGNKNTHIVLCAPAMLESNFMTELAKYEPAYKNAVPGHIDPETVYFAFSSNGKLLMQSKHSEFADKVKDAVVIMDESQLFIASVLRKMDELKKYKALKEQREKNNDDNGNGNGNELALKPANETILDNYYAMMNEDTCRIVCLSGTPIVSNPREIAVLINLLAKCPKMHVFDNPHGLTDINLKALVESYGNANSDVFFNIDFGRSDIRDGKIRIVRNPMHFINKGGSIVYDNHQNTESDSVYKDKLISVFGSIIETVNKEPIFNVETFNQDYALLPNKSKPYNIATDDNTRITSRTALINNVEDFKRKCAGFISYFGNIDSILPKTHLYLGAGHPDENDTRMLQIGRAYNGSDLFTVRRCQYSSLTEKLIKSKVMVKHGLEWLSFMNSSKSRFMYPFMVQSEDELDRIMSNIAEYFDTQIEKHFNNDIDKYSGSLKLQNATDMKYYMKYINIVLRPASTFDSDTNKLTHTFDFSKAAINYELKNRNKKIEKVSHWVRTEKETANNIQHKLEKMLEDISLNQNTGDDADLLSKENIQRAFNKYVEIIKDTLFRIKAFRCCWYHPTVHMPHPTETKLNDKSIVYLDDISGDSRFMLSDVEYLQHIPKSELLNRCSPKLIHLNNILESKEIEARRLDMSFESNSSSGMKELKQSQKIIIYSEYKQTSIPLTRVLFDPEMYEELKIKKEKGKIRILNDLANYPYKKRYMFITGSGQKSEDDELDVNILNSFLKDKSEGNTDKSLKQHYIDIFNGDTSDPIYSNVRDDIERYLSPGKNNICDIVVLNSAAAEGITLKEVRHVVIYHLPSDMSKIYQIIGRAVRNCTHSKLPEDEQTVMPVVFLNKSSGTGLTKEEEAYNEYVNVSEEFVPYLNALKETAIDCKLNSAIINKSTGGPLYPNLQCLTTKKNMISTAEAFTSGKFRFI